MLKAFIIGTMLLIVNISVPQNQNLITDGRKIDVPKPVKQLEEPKVEEVKDIEPMVAAPAAPVLTGGVVNGCGDNEYANYIYMHESGCRLDANNGSCIGIGQACPSSKLLAVCPDLNYECQNSFFTSYAINRFGSWAGAYSFWLQNHWW